MGSAGLMDRRIDGLEDWIAVSMFICIAAIGVAIIFVVAIDGEHNRRGDVDIHNSNGRLYRRRGDVNCCGFVRRRDDLVITAATPIYISRTGVAMGAVASDHGRGRRHFQL